MVETQNFGLLLAQTESKTKTLYSNIQEKHRNLSFHTVKETIIGFRGEKTHRKLSFAESGFNLVKRK